MATSPVGINIFHVGACPTAAKPISGSMYDFSCQIAAGEIFQSLAISFEPLDSTVLLHYPPVPECVKHAIG